MDSDAIVGQVLDGKYSIEDQLGKGGMGTVYLSTHVGTGRPVAVKIIAPDFMKRTEFVERFRREAKAAGRLRHPNVVDVTDFGFAELENGENAAYLVMEFLDGCTLGEVLDEEKSLPVEFSVNILEQVCSAVEEAHNQGIIHRDLKPDNIWLEPNQRGGYTVKVLDFGIAKLEETRFTETDARISQPSLKTVNPGLPVEKKTIADEAQSETVIDKNSSTMVAEGETVALVDDSNTLVSEGSESGTVIQEIKPAISHEEGTAILPSNQTRTIKSDDSKGTIILSDETDKSNTHADSTVNLTKVGAVLGTPLYMSPEQCRGEKLTASSDIYSLAVIAYQMLSGKLPFTGDYLKVMEGHKNETPQEITTKKVPKKLKGIVMQSLSKKIAERPDTAEAFASKLRSNSEGIGKLLRRSLVIYSQNLPKFLQITLLSFIPVIFLFLVRTVLGISIGFGFLEEGIAMRAIFIGLEVLNFFFSIVSSALLVGMMTWVVAQFLAFPLRPLSLRLAFHEVKKRAKSLAFTVGLSTVFSTIGFFLCILPGFFLSAKFMLVAPSIMMEDVKGRAAFRRSFELTKRSFSTVLATALLVYVIPLVFGFTVGGVIAVANTAYLRSLETQQMKEKMKTMEEEGFVPKKESSPVKKESDDVDLKISINSREVSINSNDTEPKTKEEKELKDKVSRFGAISSVLSQFLLLPLIILLSSFTSVITALLYFKTRQSGGESMQELLGKLDDADQSQSKWQQRVRERLIQSGKITGKTTNPNRS